MQNIAENEIELTDIIELPNGERPSRAVQLDTQTAMQYLHNTEASSHEVEGLDILFDNDTQNADVVQYNQISNSLAPVDTHSTQEHSPLPEANEDVDTLIDSIIAEDTLEYLHEGNLPQHHETITHHKQENQMDSSTHSDPLNKLDNLDAMIDSIMVTTQETFAKHEDILHCQTQILALQKRIDYIEAQEKDLLNSIATYGETIKEFQEQKNSSIHTKTEENTREEYTKLIEEKIHTLDAKMLSIIPRIEDMDMHLNGLLTISKRVNDLETSIHSALGNTTSDIGLSDKKIIEIEQNYASLAKSFKQYEETQEGISVLSQRFQLLEERMNYISEKMNEKEDHKVVEQQTLAITEKLSQLEHTIENILQNYTADTEKHSLENLQKTLTPIIEKGATEAAARIIREELQALLAME